MRRAEHSISRKNIDDNALQVLYRLNSLGYTAYLVGGGVRDLFLGKRPKDFDVGTDARPSRLKRVFRNSRIIGRRFRIAHVYFPGDEIVEVATFRRGTQTVVQGRKGPMVRDNEYGTPEEDALRRDLTINGLFYDLRTFSVIDYVGGVKDLEEGIIRTINDPDFSYREDPVRMIRAQRHAARTGFTIEERTLEGIHRHAGEIVQANPSRLLEEILRDLRGAASREFFRLAWTTGLLEHLMPELASQLHSHGESHPLWRRLEVLDRRVRELDDAPTSAVLLAILLHTVLELEPEYWLGTKGNPPNVWNAVSARLRDQERAFRITRRDGERMAQILISFPKFHAALERGRLTPALAAKTYLREALEFLRTVVAAEGKTTELIDRWIEEAPPLPVREPRYRFQPRTDRRKKGDDEKATDRPRGRRRRPRRDRDDHDNRDDAASSTPQGRGRNKGTESSSDDGATAGGTSGGAEVGEEAPRRPRRRRRRRRKGAKGAP